MLNIILTLYLRVIYMKGVPLQLVQNSPARLQNSTRTRQSITPVLASLHWLQIKYRTDSGIILYVSSTFLNSSALSLTPDLLDPLRICFHCRLLLLAVPWSRLAPKLWNSLPLSIKCALSIFTFKLKTHLFSMAFKCF